MSCRRDKVRNSLKVSFLDGSFFSVMFGVGDTFLNPYAIFLKATSFQIGLLSSLPGLVSALIQFRAPELTEQCGRYRIMKWGVFAHALMWLPMILLPYIFPSHAASWLILFVTLYLLFSSLAAPAWASIMSQYLPASKRNRYFSWRQRFQGIITLIATFAAGYVLFLFPKSAVTGFTVIFSVAFACRIVSWYFITKMHEPRLDCKPGAYFSFGDFLHRLPESNFAKFVFFVGAMSLAVNLAGPFFTVYMLRDMKLDYLTFVLLNTTPTLAMLFSLRAWGRQTDRVGSIRTMRLTSLLIPVLPLMWLVNQSIPYLIFAQAVSGFAWGGFNLAASNFIYDAVTEEKRVRCVAYFNLINGVGIFIGAALGGFLIPRLPQLLGSGILTIFLISGVLRLVVRWFFMPRLREVKKVEAISNLNLLINVSGVKPAIRVAQNTLGLE